MTRSLLVLAALASAAVALAPTARSGTDRTLTPLASVEIVGSGKILWRQVAVRVAPTRTAPVITTLTQFRDDYYPRTVMALSATRKDGRPAWYRISIPGRPNGRSGWIPAASAHIVPVDRWLVIYRESRRFAFYVDGKVVRKGPVAVGAPGMETPIGLFYVQAKFVPERYPVLGAFAFETSGYSKLSDWPGGGVVGVHGTNTPQLIGQAVSHGCVRLLNEDVSFLRPRVGPGVPVKIVRA